MPAKRESKQSRRKSKAPSGGKKRSPPRRSATKPQPTRHVEGLSHRQITRWARADERKLMEAVRTGKIPSWQVRAVYAERRQAAEKGLERAERAAFNRAERAERERRQEERAFERSAAGRAAARAQYVKDFEQVTSLGLYKPRKKITRTRGGFIRATPYQKRRIKRAAQELEHAKGRGDEVIRIRGKPATRRRAAKAFREAGYTVVGDTVMIRGKEGVHRRIRRKGKGFELVGRAKGRKERVIGIGQGLGELEQREGRLLGRIRRLQGRLKPGDRVEVGLVFTSGRVQRFDMQSEAELAGFFRRIASYEPARRAAVLMNLRVSIVSDEEE